MRIYNVLTEKLTNFCEKSGQYFANIIVEGVSALGLNPLPFFALYPVLWSLEEDPVLGQPGCGSGVHEILGVFFPREK